MIEFIEFNENKTGIKFLSKFDNDKTVILSVSDGYTGLNLWKDRINIKPNVIYFFNAQIFSSERKFEIYDEHENEKLFSIFVKLNGYPSIQKQDKLNILKSYNHDYKEEGVGLPVFEIFLNKTYESEDVQIEENDIVFDIGGTLLPTPAKIVIARLAKEYKIPLELHVIREMKINALVDEVKSYGIDSDKFFDRYWEIYSEEVKKESLFPETRIVLEKLKEQGSRLAIFSDIRLYIINEIFQTHNLSHFFEDVACLDNVPPKPEPDGLNHLANCLSVSKHEMLLVGDRIVDKISADRAGVRSYIIDQSSDLMKLIEIIINI